MRTIRSVVLVVVSILFASMLAGCTTKEERISKYLFKQAHNNASRVYNASGAIYPDHTFEDWNIEVKKPIINSIGTREVLGITMHGVKCEIVYLFTSKKSGETEFFIRYAKLTLEEDIFKAMIPHHSQDEEVIFVAPSLEAAKKAEKMTVSIAAEGRKLVD